MLAPKPQKYKHHVMSTFGWQETNKGNIPYKVQLFIFTSRDIFVQNWKRWHSRFLLANDATFSDSMFPVSTAGKLVHFSKWLRRQGAILPVYSRQGFELWTCLKLILSACFMYDFKRSILSNNKIANGLNKLSLRKKLFSGRFCFARYIWMIKGHKLQCVACENMSVLFIGSLPSLNLSDLFFS